MPLVDDVGTILWVITRDSVEATLLPLTTDELDELVQRVRRGTNLHDIPEGKQFPTFDADAAKSLYKAILAPAKAAIKSRTNLIFIPDGALQTLPLHVLITDDKQPEWVATQYAVTVMPSAGALQAARSAGHVIQDQAAFLGVGNPELPTTAPNAETDTNPYRAALRDAIAGLPALPEMEMENTRKASFYVHDKSHRVTVNPAPK